MILIPKYSNSSNRYECVLQIIFYRIEEVQKYNKKTFEKKIIAYYKAFFCIIMV